jgi:transcriptional regulator with PAS, ATPase and Fis domain
MSLSSLPESEATLALRSQIKSGAPRSATVLIEGETGVGKEVAAREIHAQSLRVAKAFVPVDCTALTSDLIESQLFGHVKGAFTGAAMPTLGMLRCADGGTLFLDEVGELPLEMQAKLLRCLQERAVLPLGATEAVAIDVRVIVATHRDLARMVRDGRFREDLYFRINVVRLTVRPLRERPEDVVRLASCFLEEFAKFYEEPVKVLARDAQSVLLGYDWPGNVRELRNTIERAHLFCNDRTVVVEHLPREIREGVTSSPVRGVKASDPIPSLAEAERTLIARALKAAGGNQSKAARALGVERHRLRRLIKRHGLVDLPLAAHR